jgi:lysophospholipase L1-like esterase
MCSKNGLGAEVAKVCFYFGVILGQLSVPLTAAFAQQPCDRSDIELATSPTPPQFDFALRRHADLVETSARVEVDVIAIGDSLIEQWPQALLLGVFPNQRIVNFGVGGDKTQNVLWRLETKAFDSLRPQTVIVLIGSANLSGNQTSCAIAAGVAAVVNDIKQRWNPREIVLIELLPRCKDPPAKLQERLQINAMFRERFKTEPGMTLVNADDVLMCNSQLYHDDYIHLTPSGYKALTEQLTIAVSGRP